jgi:hypothetical protein
VRSDVKRRKVTCLVCFSNAMSFSMAPCTLVYEGNISYQSEQNKIIVEYQSQRLRLGELFVNFLGEVLVRFEDLDVGHGGGCGE